jgi:RimJ/RimL family protein N-acetyltransferase
MIKGPRVQLRAVEESDLPLLQQWTNDSEISQLVGGWSFPISMAQQREWFQRSLGDSRTQRFVVESESEGVLGLTGLWDIDWHNRHALTALKLGSPNVRGKGYGTDAIMTLMSYAFLDVGLNKLWTTILTYNIASYKAYVEHCGWRVEGVLRQEVYRAGQYNDLLRVGILREEFLVHPQANRYISALTPGFSSVQVVISHDHLSSALADNMLGSPKADAHE